MDVQEYLNQWTSQPVGYNTRDLLLYAVGIGASDLRFIYENDGDFAAFPTFPIVLNFSGVEEDVVPFPSEALSQGPNFPPLEGTRFVLDGERFIEQLNPLPTEGAALTLKQRLIGVHKRGSGALVETEAILLDEKTGKEYYRMGSGAFLVGAGGFTDAGTTLSQKVAVPDRAPDATVELPTSQTQAQVYRLSGDYNPLHVDPDIAQMNGFQEPILHGLCSLGFSARAVLKTFGDNDPEKFKALKLRFAKPVLPGQTLVVDMWNVGGGRIVFLTKVKETGKTVINNAYVELHGEAQLGQSRL